MAAERLDTETRQEQIKKAVLEIISTEGMENIYQKSGIEDRCYRRSSSSDIFHPKRK